MESGFKYLCDQKCRNDDAVNTKQLGNDGVTLLHFFCHDAVHRKLNIQPLGVMSCDA